MSRTTTRLTAGAAALALTLLLVGCGDDGDDAADDTTTTEQPDSESTTGSTMGEQTDDTEATAEADVVDTAVEAGDFTTLVAAVQAAGLEETLRGSGPFTVFAPTDAAFEALPAGTVDALLADPGGDLTDILTYHVVEGEVLAADVVGLDGQDVATVNGASFTVDVGTDGAVTLTDAAGNEVRVVATDVMATNGVIHVVDAVLMPG